MKPWPSFILAWIVATAIGLITQDLIIIVTGVLFPWWLMGCFISPVIYVALIRFYDYFRLVNLSKGDNFTMEKEF